MFETNNETALPLAKFQLITYKEKHYKFDSSLRKSCRLLKAKCVFQEQERTNQGRIEGEREERERKAKGEREEGRGKEGQKEGEKKNRRK